MKIGVLSMQRVMNYGSFLQGFALKKTLEGLGHTCEFVEIEQGIIFPELKRTFSFLLKKAVERYFKGDVLKRLRYARVFHRRFHREFFDLLEVNKHTIPRFDTVVIGSDEVFNFAQRVSWGYTLQLYGQVDNARKVISYAGSFGHTTLEDIFRFGCREEIASAMKNMSAVSVRDFSSRHIVKELTGREPEIHIDPVLMFDYQSFVMPVHRENYIIIYTYPNRIQDKREISAIKAFAQKQGKRLISIGFYFSWCDETVVPHPFEVLGYVREADFVMTDTFHGSVMSIKFNRPFAALIRPSNRQKMTSLLSQFHLEDRCVEDMDNLEATLLSDIDYHAVNKQLQIERARSLEYLKTNL